MYTIVVVFEGTASAAGDALVNRSFDSLAEAQEAVYAQFGDLDWRVGTDRGKEYCFTIGNPIIMIEMKF